ncbi:hypothetical protein KC614_02470 [candidate division WWE3 bacterium]|uniref:Uncharacterized protein n=1 Tax=candidate division WWE3 bacterium TaxID=2053526 RepID=A0A955LKP2_UNCKA|nr:hypothetical protein [candidate division WWE3 bacterium]
MSLINDLLPILLQPKNLVILTVIFLVVYWILNTLKFISSIILKILVALLIVTVVAYLLGITNLGALT